MHSTLRIATFNIHKGLTHFNARFAIHEQRELLRNLRSDIVFLQEVWYVKDYELLANCTKTSYHISDFDRDTCGAVNEVS